MEYPRIIPHSGGAGVVAAVGPGVDEARVGRAAWRYGAQSYRQFGTAAEFVVIPSELAVDLPPLEEPNQAGALAEQAACRGIAGITAHRAGDDSETFKRNRKRPAEVACVERTKGRAGKGSDELQGQLGAGDRRLLGDR